MLLRKTGEYRIECDDGIRKFTYTNSNGTVINGPRIGNLRIYGRLKNGYENDPEETVNRNVDLLFKSIHGDVDEAVMVA